jgi:hypothetical protein
MHDALRSTKPRLVEQEEALSDARHCLNRLEHGRHRRRAGPDREEAGNHILEDSK